MPGGCSPGDGESRTGVSAPRSSSVANNWCRAIHSGQKSARCTAYHHHDFGLFQVNYGADTRSGKRGGRGKIFRVAMLWDLSALGLLQRSLLRDVLALALAPSPLGFSPPLPAPPESHNATGAPFGAVCWFSSSPCRLDARCLLAHLGIERQSQVGKGKWQHACLLGSPLGSRPGCLVLEFAEK